MNLETVSSDDVLASYRQQLSDAHNRIAVLEAQLVKARKILMEREQAAQVIREDSP